jgi:protein-S-isoprenylcysteine O-methyltransferase Ste14
MIEALRLGCLVLIGLLLLVVLDAPLRTFGQRYVVNRLRERLILLGVEFDLVLFWALAVFLFHLDRRLLAPAHEEALAAAGALLVLAGAGLALWARLRLGRWFTGTLGVKVGHELVSDGPYAVTRHPMYTGLLIMMLGAALAWNSVSTLVLAVLLVVPFVIQARIEEPLLEGYFGEAYREYRRRVPRLLPWPRPSADRPPSPS